MNIGKLLDSPIRQSLLPCLSRRGIIYGCVVIDPTIFDGELLTLDIGGFDYDLFVVNVPQRVFDESNLQVRQYVALVFEDEVLHTKPWEGIPGFLDAKEGSYATIVVNTTAVLHRNSAGLVGEGLLYGLSLPGAKSSVPEVPEIEATPVVFAATVNSKVMFESLNYFDFDWMLLFKKKSPLTPIRLQIDSNPAGGVFKAVLVAPSGREPVLSTVRVVCISEGAPPPSLYVFRFTVTCKEGSVPCELLLTLT